MESFVSRQAQSVARSDNELNQTSPARRAPLRPRRRLSYGADVLRMPVRAMLASKGSVWPIASQRAPLPAVTWRCAGVTPKTRSATLQYYTEQQAASLLRSREPDCLPLSHQVKFAHYFPPAPSPIGGSPLPAERGRTGVVGNTGSLGLLYSAETAASHSFPVTRNRCARPLRLLSVRPEQVACVA
jgi:hypothetical protein